LYKRFLLICFILLPGLVAFRQSSPISMNIQAGIGGWYRSGQWIPLQVRVDSQTVTMDGYLQVRVGSLTSSVAQLETTYRTPFNITENSSKRVFLYISLDDFSSDVQVELLDKEGRVIANQRESIRQLRHEDILYGVVSDSSTGFLDVSRFAIGRGRSYQTAWRIADIPPLADALRSLDVLVFTDVDTGNLSSDQQQAIADWTASGGHLIVTGGANWQRTTSGLGDLLPTAPQETRTIDEVSALGEFLRLDPSELETTTLVAASAPKRGASVLVVDEGVPLLIRGGLGAGTVDFVAFDATTEPLRSWDELPYLWQELVRSAGSRPSWSHGVERFDLARSSVSNVTGFDLPGVLQIAAFLLAYILLMGPLNYVLLSLLRRRELAWFTIPVLIVVFTAFAYFTGFSVRGDSMTVNQVSVVQVWDDYTRARVDGVIGVLSPRRTTYDLLIRDDLNLRSLPNQGGSASISQMTITQGENYLAEGIPVDAAIMTNFATSGYIPKPDFSGTAIWELRGGQLSTRLNGEVTNGLPTALEDAVIIADDVAFKIGDLAPGETRPFQLTLPLANPQRLTQGSRVDPQYPVRPSGFSGSAAFNGLCYMSNGLNVVYELVMQDGLFNCGGGGSAEELILRRRGLIVAATNNEIDRSGGRGMGVYLLGWSASPPLQIEIPTAGKIDDGTALYIYEIPTTLDVGNPNRVILPPGMFNWTLIELDQPNRLPEVNPDLSFQITANQGVAVRFMPLPGVPLRQVDEFSLTVDWRLGGGGVRVSLWNWESQEWQAVEFSNPDQTQFIIENPAYVGVQNAVQVLVESESASAFQTVSELSITMRGRS